MSARFGWDEAMAWGFRTLRLSPNAFWSLTPRELAATLPAGAAAVPGRAWLADALERYPDEERP